MEYMALHYCGYKTFSPNVRIKLKVGTCLSDPAALVSGVIQGSGIGPIMFLVYINELAVFLEEFGIKVKLFADDVKLYIQIVNDTHIKQLQKAVDALVCWTTEWQLSISVCKCCILNVGKVIQTACLNINGVVLPVVTSARDLGVTVSHDLSSALHISNIVPKAHSAQQPYIVPLFVEMLTYLCVHILRMCGLLLNMTL